MTQNSRFKISLITIFSIAVSCIPLETRDAFAGDYLSSIHGSNVQRPDLAGVYATGNCAHCHEQHSGITTTTAGEPSPSDPPGPDVYLEGGNEEVLCFECHDGSPTTDIKTDVNTPGNHGHLAQNYTNIHRMEETLTDISESPAKKHIECTDCHNPHAVGNNLHTPGSETVATLLAPDSPLNEVTGADPGYDTSAPSIWAAPDQADYTLQQPATKEYQICFKCHSGSVGDPETWRGGSGSDPAGTSWSWTDVGQEFNIYNRSGHPVVTGLRNYPNSLPAYIGGPGNPYVKGLRNMADPTQYDQLLDSWSNNEYQTMYCSDCHEGANAAGPHGSSVKWMLAGPNKAWPYLLASDNGSSQTETTATLFRRLATIETNLGGTNGLFCANCHPITSSTYQTAYSTNKVHVSSWHLNGRCVDCHIRVPHGGKVSRLILAVEGGTYTGYVPPRYTANGAGMNGDGTNAAVLGRFSKKLNSSYASFDCYANFYSALNAVSGKSCTEHAGKTGQLEAWDIEP